MGAGVHDAKAKTFVELDEKLHERGVIEKSWGGRSLPFPTLLDDTGETVRNYSIRAFPTVLLIDPDGTVVKIGGHHEVLAQLESELEIDR